MSIFEKQTSAKVSIDDTIPLRAVIINSETNNGHTEYVIRVHRGYGNENAWHIHRRYNDFHALHKELSVAGADLSLPPKKIIGNMEREFILQRLDGLQSYLNEILKNPTIANQKAVKIFLDPHNYSSVKEIGATQISIKLKCDIGLKVVRQLPHIGRRLRKEHYFVQNVSTKEELVLTWTPYGPDKYLSQKKITAIMKSLSAIQHAHIAPITKTGVCNDGAWVLRPSWKCGSLLDQICGVKTPLTVPALKKYANDSVRSPMHLSDALHISAQILQALAFLHNKGISYGHLHLGNVLYEDGVVSLLDLENQLFGLPPYYRDLITRNRLIRSMFDVDLFCFGLVIYEMVYGKEYNFNDSRLLLNCPVGMNALGPVLELLLVEEGKSCLPSIEQLLKTSLFLSTVLIPSPFLHLSSSSQHDLSLNGMETFQRLKDDHMKYRQHIRTTKLYEMLNGDGGKLFLVYETKKSVSKSSSCDSDQPRSELSDGAISSRTPTPSAASEGTTVSEENIPHDSGAVNDRSLLLGAICNFNKKNLKKVTIPN